MKLSDEEIQKLKDHEYPDYQMSQKISYYKSNLFLRETMKLNDKDIQRIRKEVYDLFELSDITLRRYAERYLSKY